MKVLPPIGSADYLFPAANGQVLARADDKVSLFDMSQKRVIGECSATKVCLAVALWLLPVTVPLDCANEIHFFCGLHPLLQCSKAGLGEGH